MLPNDEPIWHILLYTWQCIGRLAEPEAQSSSSFRIMFRIVLLILGQNHDMIYGFGRSFLSASSIRCVQMDSFSVYFIQRLSKYFHICKRNNARTFFFSLMPFIASVFVRLMLLLLLFSLVLSVCLCSFRVDWCLFAETILHVKCGSLSIYLSSPASFSSWLRVWMCV